SSAAAGSAARPILPPPEHFDQYLYAPRPLRRPGWWIGSVRSAGTPRPGLPARPRPVQTPILPRPLLRPFHAAPTWIRSGQLGSTLSVERRRLEGAWPRAHGGAPDRPNLRQPREKARNRSPRALGAADDAF